MGLSIGFQLANFLPKVKHYLSRTHTHTHTDAPTLTHTHTRRQDEKEWEHWPLQEQKRGTWTQDNSWHQRSAMPQKSSSYFALPNLNHHFLLLLVRNTSDYHNYLISVVQDYANRVPLTTQTLADDQRGFFIPFSWKVHCSHNCKSGYNIIKHKYLSLVRV